MKTSMDPCEPILTSCESQQASCQAKVLYGPPTFSSSESNLALSELTITFVGANFASHRVRDGSLHLASGEAIPAYSGHKAEVALDRAKA